MKKTLFILLSVAFFASCNNEETPNPSGNSESKVDLPKTEIFVQGQNLLSFDNISAMDAENLNTGYPVMKSVNIGLSVQF